MREWLLSCPCVMDGRVLIDVRGPWPIALVGMRAQRIESKEDFIAFIVDAL